MILVAALYFNLASAQSFPVTNISVNGPQTNRINIAVLAEGYTQAQQPKFIQDVHELIMNGVFTNSPFKEYKNFYNVYAIEVPSVDSGSDHPATATDVIEPYSPFADVNTYFSTTFDESGIHRMLYYKDMRSVYSVLSNSFPSYDKALVLVNSPVYGGTGGDVSVSSTHPLSIGVIMHEWGHSFVGLADEYLSGYYREQPHNMTAVSNPSLIKWRNWLGVNGTGIYPYPNQIWYKPSMNCNMEFVWSPFCSVCSEALMDFVYQSLTPIDNALPDTLTTVSYVGNPLRFTLNLVKPDPYSLTVKWVLNGVTLSGTDTTLLLAGTQLNPGANVLKAFITDTTALSRSYWPSAGHQFSVTWKISKSATGISQVNQQADAYKFSYKLYPSPVNDQLTIEYNNKTPDTKVDYSLMDMSGRLIRSGTLELTKGTGSFNISCGDIFPGQYFLIVKSKNIHVDTKLIKR